MTAGTGLVKINHAKMKAVVDRLDRLIESLNSSGNAGSYASLGEAGKVAQAVCTIAEPEMATFVNKYNQGFGAAVREYQSLCTTLVEIRNAVANTANIHLSNDEIQARAFKPLEDDGLKVDGGVNIHGHHFGGYDDHTTTGTTAAGNQANNGSAYPNGTSSANPPTDTSGSEQHTTTLAPGPLDGSGTHTDPNAANEV